MCVYCIYKCIYIYSVYKCIFCMYGGQVMKAHHCTCVTIKASQLLCSAFCSAAAGNSCEFLPVSRSGYAAVWVRVRICKTQNRQQRIWVHSLHAYTNNHQIFLGSALYFDPNPGGAHLQRRKTRSENSLRSSKPHWWHMVKESPLANIARETPYL